MTKQILDGKYVVVRNCEECGEKFSPLPRNVKAGNGRFCSIKCGTHATRRKMFARFEVKFWSKVDTSSGPNTCWPWTGALRSDGYGVITHRRIQRRAHRLSYEFVHGAITNDLIVCHACDNPQCCNPKHLFLGTVGDNMRDKVAKKRHPFGDTHPARKLNTADVLEIRQLLSDGLTPSKVALRFGVSRIAILDIRDGRRWAHLISENANAA